MAGLGDYWRLLKWGAFGGQPGKMPQPGTPAPDFAVPDDSGTERTLGEFAGKILVLWFYPKAATPG